MSQQRECAAVVEGDEEVLQGDEEVLQGVLQLKALGYFDILDVASLKRF